MTGRPCSARHTELVLTLTDADAPSFTTHTEISLGAGGQAAPDLLHVQTFKVDEVPWQTRDAPVQF